MYDKHGRYIFASWRFALAFFAALVVGQASSGVDAASPNESEQSDKVNNRRFALLVGCTHYENPKIRPLRGSVNDVRDYQRLLAKDPTGFGFDASDVAVLSGWPDDPSLRPTYDNIVAAFERLKIGKG